MHSVKVGRIPVHLFTEETLHQEIKNIITSDQKKTVLNSNAHLVQLANSDEPWLIDYFNNEVDFVMCDGSGIQLGAKLTGQLVPEKIAYNVWFWNFAEFCANNNFSIYFLGAKDGVAKMAAENLVNKNPDLRVYYHHGYFDKSSNSAENEEVIRRINEVKPNVLLVCFGMPFQERYIRENISRFNTNVLMSGGGALDFFAGKAKTAPAIFRHLYLEWFYRLCSDPRRLWKRYLVGNFKYLYYVLKYRNDK
ncbi:MAG: WecB/TagA/CpsF family glycosyltransferase [Bacteroidota bacterium]